MIIYIDEPGDLALNINRKGTSNFLVLRALVCDDSQANRAIVCAVKKTLENKIANNIHELKGNNTIFTIKQNFLNRLRLYNNWHIYAVVANKKTWLKNHNTNHNCEPENKILHDEVVSHLFAQLEFPNTKVHVQIIVDRSKYKIEIDSFYSRITSAIAEKISTITRLSIRHGPSYEDPGLQAIDLFCWGISRKY